MKLSLAIKERNCAFSVSNNMTALHDCFDSLTFKKISFENKVCAISFHHKNTNFNCKRNTF